MLTFLLVRYMRNRLGHLIPYIRCTVSNVLFVGWNKNYPAIHQGTLALLIDLFFEWGIAEVVKGSTVFDTLHPTPGKSQRIA